MRSPTNQQCHTSQHPCLQPRWTRWRLPFLQRCLYLAPWLCCGKLTNLPPTLSWTHGGQLVMHGQLHAGLQFPLSSDLNFSILWILSCTCLFIVIFNSSMIFHTCAFLFKVLCLWIFRQFILCSIEYFGLYCDSFFFSFCRGCLFLLVSLWYS